MTNTIYKQSNQNHVRMMDLPIDLRPIERIKYSGEAALNEIELLAAILRTGGDGENALGLAQRLLIHYGTLREINNASFYELCGFHNIGESKAATIKAALEIGKRVMTQQRKSDVTINSPADAANLLMLEMGLLEREELRVILLDSRRTVKQIKTVYTGSLHTVTIRMSELFTEAIRTQTMYLMLVHNHPSGDPRPSPEDVIVTKQAVETGNLLDIELLDHIIIGDRCYVSLKEKGLGF